MADHTSGTVVASPLGDFWLGTIELSNGQDADNVGIQAIMGRKIGGIAFANANSGTCSFSTTSGTVTLSGTSNFVFFQALSKAQ